MGGMKGGSKLQDPWASKENKQMAGFARDPLMNAGNTDITGIGQDLAAGNQYQTDAGAALQSFNPSSFYAGNEGAFNDVQDFTKAGADSIGAAQPLLNQTLGGQFLDVANNPFYQARNQGIINQTNRALLGNLDMVDASAQRATGGVGAGSAGMQQRTRAITGANQSLGDTLAQLGGQDFARERANQMGAMGMAGDFANQFAGLGAIQGQAGTAAGELGLKQAMGLADFGGNMAQQQFQGNMLPYMQLLNYLGLAKGVQVQQPNIWGNMSGMMSGAGDLMGGISKFT